MRPELLNCPALLMIPSKAETGLKGLRFPEEPHFHVEDRAGADGASFQRSFQVKMRHCSAKPGRRPGRRAMRRCPAGQAGWFPQRASCQISDTRRCFLALQRRAPQAPALPRLWQLYSVAAAALAKAQFPQAHSTRRWAPGLQRKRSDSRRTEQALQPAQKLKSRGSSELSVGSRLEFRPCVHVALALKKHFCNAYGLCLCT